MLDPLITAIEVPCTQEQAFRVFVEEMGNWWPLDKRSASMIGGQPAKSLRVEARLGGQIIETGHDDAEHLWGTFMTYDPYDSVSMAFHMGMPADSASLVEVQFTVLGEERTRVVLTQSNWEAFGDMAEMMRGGYGSGWVIIFEESYRAACAARR